MQSKARFLGHSLHQMFVVFPLGLLATASIFDLISIIYRTDQWFSVSFRMIPAGIIGGLIAAVFGLIDWSAIPDGTRAKKIGLMHAAGNVVVLALFAASFWLRRLAPGNPSQLALGMSFFAVGLALVTGWLGGELVDRLGVGVDDNANLNATSSLRSRQAYSQTR